MHARLRAPSVPWPRNWLRFVFQHPEWEYNSNTCSRQRFNETKPVPVQYQGALKVGRQVGAPATGKAPGVRASIAIGRRSDPGRIHRAVHRGGDTDRRPRQGARGAAAGRETAGLSKPKLLIVDEPGYLPLELDAAHLFVPTGQPALRKSRHADHVEPYRMGAVFEGGFKVSRPSSPPQRRPGYPPARSRKSCRESRSSSRTLLRSSRASFV